MTSTEVRAGFPADPASAAKARRFVETTLRGWRCDRLVDATTLLVSELVANAILHAGTTIQVVIRSVNERLRIEVHDDDPRMPVRKHYSTLSATGRGLLLVERLAAAWGSDATPSGKVVWFELDLESAPAANAGELFDLDDPSFDLDDLSSGGGWPSGQDDAGGSRGGQGLRLYALSSRR